MNLSCKKNPDVTDALNNVGVLYFQKKAYQKAYEYLVRAEAGNPGRADIHNNLGMLLLDMGKYEEAQHQFESAVKIEQQGAQSDKNAP